MSPIEFIVPEWPVSPRVHAVSTLRRGGVSVAPYDTFNLGADVGDEVDAVAENRRRLGEQLGLDGEPCWLKQVHGANVVRAGEVTGERPQADAAIAAASDQICAILTADCMPVLLARTDGTRVAAAHAGWRGLASGVLESTIAALETPPRELAAWLGPAIGPDHFEVGSEVRAAFLRIDPAAVTAFRANARGRWMCDLYRLAHQHLNRAGVDAIFGGGRCTFAEATEFFSYRRDGRCGRMASLIWIE
ncbi:MAG TPA: peptidoglycan editing factor PgeF [Steroidobacteraceae bacterium]|nr:peptidoglycan editing factor PgeF [Steroidobacteraceae bacterium]